MATAKTFRSAFGFLLVMCLAAGCGEPVESAPAPPPAFPAVHRSGTADLVIYQVWLNSYAKNAALGQESPDVFANAATHLDALARLGVTAIQLSPFHPFGSQTTIGSPYAIQDYDDVNPGYVGAAATRTERIAALKRFVDQAHTLGMRVVMDCVYHSTAPDNVLVAQHPDYYVHDAEGAVTKNKYGFAELDLGNPAVGAYLIEMTKRWARQAGIDGCRADVAVYVPLSFWAMLNNELKKIKPDWLMIAETGSLIAEYAGTYSGPGYQGAEYQDIYGFDAVYGVLHMMALRGILNAKAGAGVLAQAWRSPDRLKSVPPKGTVFYRGVDNHDQAPRAAALAAGNAGMLAAMAINFTLDGIPFLFNGQEIGDTNRTSIWVQRFIAWNAPPHPENAARLTKLAALRRAHPALNQGETAWCAAEKPQSVVAYLRETDRERMLVAVNLGGAAFSGAVTCAASQPLGHVSDLISGATFTAAGREVALTLAPYSYLIGEVH